MGAHDEQGKSAAASEHATALVATPDSGQQQAHQSPHQYDKYYGKYVAQTPGDKYMSTADKYMGAHDEQGKSAAAPEHATALAAIPDSGQYQNYYGKYIAQTPGDKYMSSADKYMGA